MANLAILWNLRVYSFESIEATSPIIIKTHSSHIDDDSLRATEHSEIRIALSMRVYKLHI
jgi:hypothetical protein